MPTPQQRDSPTDGKAPEVEWNDRRKPGKPRPHGSHVRFDTQPTERKGWGDHANLPQGLITTKSGKHGNIGQRGVIPETTERGSLPPPPPPARCLESKTPILIIFRWFTPTFASLVPLPLPRPRSVPWATLRMSSGAVESGCAQADRCPHALLASGSASAPEGGEGGERPQTSVPIPRPCVPPPQWPGRGLAEHNDGRLMYRNPLAVGARGERGHGRWNVTSKQRHTIAQTVPWHQQRRCMNRRPRCRHVTDAALAGASGCRARSVGRGEAHGPWVMRYPMWAETASAALPDPNVDDVLTSSNLQTARTETGRWHCVRHGCRPPAVEGVPRAKRRGQGCIRREGTSEAAPSSG